MNAYMHTYMHTYIHAYTNVYLYIYIYIYTPVRTHTHRYFDLEGRVQTLIPKNPTPSNLKHKPKNPSPDDSYRLEVSKLRTQEDVSFGR